MMLNTDMIAARADKHIEKLNDEISTCRQLKAVYTVTLNSVYGFNSSIFKGESIKEVREKLMDLNIQIYLCHKQIELLEKIKNGEYAEVIVRGDLK